MFYCDPCAHKNGYHVNRIVASLGRCEICGKATWCNDVPSSRLPIHGREEVEAIESITDSIRRSEMFQSAPPAARKEEP